MIKLTKRVEDITESVTLKLNAKAVEMADNGKKIFNLTAGQLPFRPLPEFTQLLRDELDFLKSYQYSPVPGFVELRTKCIEMIEESRGITFPKEKTDCIISNGGKHSITNVLGALIEPGDEVITLAPYWVSYPEIVKFWGGESRVVASSWFENYTPSVEEIEKAIGPKTKVIIVNSPNNPAGISYSEKWMRDFGALLIKHPHVLVLSDEIYFELFYYDPKPTYFYQFYPELIERTILVDGISKTLASTGLRIGYTIGPKELIQAMGKLQGHTTSGANSLVQRALSSFDFNRVEDYLAPIKMHLRENAEIVRDSLRKAELGHCWYQSDSAFYYLMDFSRSPRMEKLKLKFPGVEDLSDQLCEELLLEYGVAVVPGGSFGVPNSARLSLVSPKEYFAEAMSNIIEYLQH
jgi:aspartate aminotransferase